MALPAIGRTASCDLNATVYLVARLLFSPLSRSFHDCRGHFRMKLPDVFCRDIGDRSLAQSSEHVKRPKIAIIETRFCLVSFAGNEVLESCLQGFASGAAVS
jgi:hypothetical protein